MPGTYTIDASVFLNAFNPLEDGHIDSLAFLAEVRRQAVPVIVPTLLLPELSATIARGRNDEALARSFATSVARLPGLLLVPLDSALAHQAVTVAAQARLRGSDAVYAAVAQRFGASLVTRD
jgi:predicted nucleic acid-binding protein